MGLPVYRCIRGTNAIEGLHQKIRQLIRGFNISPRFVNAVLHEFIHRLNHDTDVRMGILPENMKGFYDGWEYDEAVAETQEWNNLSQPVYPQWLPTDDFADTKEVFGINRPCGVTTFDIDKESLAMSAGGENSTDLNNADNRVDEEATVEAGEEDDEIAAEFEELAEACLTGDFCEDVLEDKDEEAIL